MLARRSADEHLGRLLVAGAAGSVVERSLIGSPTPAADAFAGLSVSPLNQASNTGS